MSESREAFEKWFKTTPDYQACSLANPDERIFSFRNGRYQNFVMQARYAAWQAQQAKIESLEREKSLQELAINQVAHANQLWQEASNKLQKKIDEFVALKSRG